MPPISDILPKLWDADEAGHIARTRHLCEAILSIEPDHGSTLVQYASSLTTLARYEEASQALDRAEAIMPRDFFHLVIAQRGHLAQAKGDFSGALVFFLQAHELDPHDASYLIYAASTAFRSGDIERAIELGRRATRCSEGCLDEAFCNLGGYLLSQKRYDEARACYVKALEIDPGYCLAQSRLADIDLLLKEFVLS